MGRLIVIEGLDGAGKNTLVDAVTASLEDTGASVARRAFPRYGHDVHADLARDALRGRVGDLADSVNGMAVLFALDRYAAAAQLAEDRANHDIVLCDRYVASNAAYGAARLHQDVDGGFVAWVHALEMERFSLPQPDAQILLRVPVSTAADRARRRERTHAERARDSYESDDGLQARCGAVYEQMAQRAWLAPWYVVDGAGAVDADALAARLW